MFNFFSVPQAHAASLVDSGSVVTLQTETVSMIGDLLDTMVTFAPWLLTLVAFGFVMGVIRRKLKA
ncbi:MAG: hypothetical protein U9Q15_05675 [Patescibacteria group bacterium]|nr:hypothetical protein [Patescibacteria group bacterium]